MSAVLDHPSLGAKIQGVSDDGVTKYLGIKYATLEHRFALPRIVEKLGEGGVIDATKVGPLAPQPPIGIDMEFGFLQRRLEKPSFEMSDTECLHLNVYAPSDVALDANLPVFAWIHGGGYAIGSIAWPQWDFTRFVRLSRDIGMPVIAVCMNYRLGVPGFLTSKELNEAGIKANRGVRDQATALEWVKRHISGFGGDPENITLAGQSMGAASATYHLHNREPQFKRLIAMGGNSLGLKPLPSALPDLLWPMVLQSLGLTNLPPDRQIEQLKTLPLEEILTKVPPNIPMLAIQDDDTITEILTFSNLSTTIANSWCSELIVGDCSLDGMILGEMALDPRRQGIGKAFTASIRKSFNEKPEVADTILRSYKIDETSPTDDKDFVQICKFASDVAFGAPSTAWAEAWSKHGPVYQYYFNVPNPWPGKYQGHPTHILDAAFFVQNFNEFLDKEQEAIAKKMASDFITHANGKTVEADFERNGVPCLVYGESEEQGTDQKTGRRIILPGIVQKGLASWDELQAAWSAFLQGA